MCIYMCMYDCRLIQLWCTMQHKSPPSPRQHSSYGDCLEVKSEYYQKCSALDCVTQCSVSKEVTYGFSIDTD